jgi:hypothetical protein
VDSVTPGLVPHNPNPLPPQQLPATLDSCSPPACASASPASPPPSASPRAGPRRISRFCFRLPPLTESPFVPVFPRNLPNIAPKVSPNSPLSLPQVCYNSPPGIPSHTANPVVLSHANRRRHFLDFLPPSVTRRPHRRLIHRENKPKTPFRHLSRSVTICHHPSQSVTPYVTPTPLSPQRSGVGSSPQRRGAGRITHHASPHVTRHPPAVCRPPAPCSVAGPAPRSLAGPSSSFILPPSSFAFGCRVPILRRQTKETTPPCVWD